MIRTPRRSARPGVRSIGAVAVLALTLGTPLFADVLTLEEALLAARAANPRLVAARLQRAVDEADIDTAREWPNPDIRYERQKETPHEGLGLSQRLELLGKRRRRIAAAVAAARSGEAELAQVEAEVLVEVRQSYFKLASAQRKAAVAAEIQALALRAREAAAARFQAGDVSRLDVLQAELALAAAENESTADAAVGRAAAVDLNTQIGREPEADTAASDDVDDSAPEDVAAATERARGNAALAVLDRRLDEAQAHAALARAERWPEPTVEATITHDALPEFVWGYRAAAGITLPLFTHHAAAVRREEAAVALLRAQRNAFTVRVRGAVAAAAAQAAAERQRYLRFRDEILPHSREVEQMAEESYRAGQSNLPALLQALQAARELRTQALQAASEYQAALGDLQAAITVGPQ
jgi:outer membrane protein, heavy metal efflux system